MDLGGQWLGPHHKHALELVNRFGFKLLQQYERGNHIVQVGDKKYFYTTDEPVKQDDPLYGLEVLAERVDKMAQQLSDSGMKESKWNEEEKKMDFVTFSKFLEDQSKDPKVGQLGSKLLEYALTTLISAEPEEYSLLFFLYFLKSCVGYHPLFDMSMKINFFF